MRHDESFDLPSLCPCFCLFDWMTRWKERRNHCDFVSLTPPLIGPEPKFDSPRLPALLPVGHIREMTHRPKSEPGLDSAQEKHLQHTERIQNTTSLQTSPSRQVQELTGPAHRTTRWLHLDRKTKSLLTRLHHPRYCAQFVQHTILCRLLRNETYNPFQSSCLTCLVHGGLGHPKHYATVSRQLCASCRFLPGPSVALLERDVHFGEVDIPEFPAQRKSV